MSGMDLDYLKAGVHRSVGRRLKRSDDAVDPYFVERFGNWITVGERTMPS